MTNLDIILKSRYITLPTKVHIVKSVVRTVKALMRVKEESEIAGLKPNIKKKKKKKTKVLASGPITSCQIEGEEVEVVTDLLFLGSKITVDGDSSCEIRCLLLGSNKPSQCVERQRHYSADKGPCNQGYGLPSGHVWL